jgi:probable phosphoglycerate mutase
MLPICERDGYPPWKHTRYELAYSTGATLSPNCNFPIWGIDPPTERPCEGGHDSMSEVLPIVYLARHGETAWTISGQHTGLTDLPLTQRGECNARGLAQRLRGEQFARVFTSPLQRARRTCELAGFGTVAEIEPDLVEWNYGEYEGRRRVDIHKERPEWQIFHDGCPGGESPGEVGARADRVIKRVRAINDNVLLFSSGHFLRVLAARWLSFEPGAGEFFLLRTASLSALSYEHNLSQPAIRLWDDDRHVADETCKPDTDLNPAGVAEIGGESPLYIER